MPFGWMPICANVKLRHGWQQRRRRVCQYGLKSWSIRKTNYLKTRFREGIPSTQSMPAATRKAWNGQFVPIRLEERVQYKQLGRKKSVQQMGRCMCIQVVQCLSHHSAVRATSIAYGKSRLVLHQLNSEKNETWKKNEDLGKKSLSNSHVTSPL